jgi:phosphonate C-P lyase system protein PhnG
MLQPDQTPAGEVPVTSGLATSLQVDGDKDELQRLWVEARPAKVEEWASVLLEGLADVRVSIPPRSGLVMMQVRDSVQQEPFCVGELLVTECQIAFKHQRIWGRVLGHQPLRALALAVLAAAQTFAPAALQSLQPAFHQEWQYLRAQWERKARSIGATRVHFDTMKAV